MRQLHDNLVPSGAIRFVRTAAACSVEGIQASLNKQTKVN
jgi:hypothetical protein